MVDILSLDYSEMEEFFVEMGEAKYRAGQLFDWIYDKKVDKFDDISNFSKKTKEYLNENAFIYYLKQRNKQISKDGTKKYLFALHDGKLIETVLMKHHKKGAGIRHTLCISTQVGCPMNCSFCATGKMGFERNLSVSEMMAQILCVEKIEKVKINNVVFMGMGEPFLNYDNLVKAVKLINFEKTFNIGIRKITVSTCGLVPEIKKYANENLDTVLAVSLHAASDEKRSSIMPVNIKYPISELKQAIEEYIEISNRRISIEYALVKGFNDTNKDIDLLVEFMKGLKGHINLIPVNETDGSYHKSDKVKSFYEKLKERNIEVSIRDEKGSDIDAACGQLKGKAVN